MSPHHAAVERLEILIPPDRAADATRQALHDSFDVVDPANERVLAMVADGNSGDARAAVDAASEAFSSWRSTAPRERSEILYRTHQGMLAEIDWLTELIVLENGKSRVDARAEVLYAAEFFRWFAEEAVRPHGDYGVSPAGGTRSIVTSRPVGVAALVTPWNFPAAMPARKIAPALAAGCTAVLKPAAETPLTALAIAKLLGAAGLPEGVLRIVSTTRPDEVVSAWMSDDRIRKVSFTGSTRVGKILLRQAADRVLNVSMELGGNAPFIVADDADITAAVQGAMIAKFRGGGQVCTAANRFYVHASVAEEFSDRFATAVCQLTVGPAAEGAQVGPLISRTAVDRLTALVDSAVDSGANLVHRTEAPAGPGYFFPPTILSDVPEDSPLSCDELFGPVAPLLTWEDERDLLGRANQYEAGLAAYVYSGSLQHALRIGEGLEVGMVGINRGLIGDPAAPFGGVKQSGVGREGARVGLEEFQEPQFLSIAWS